jgi:hypothetical protein
MPAMTRTLIGVGAITVAAVALSGCGSMRETFGFSKTAPDEFAVVTRPPLVIPPDYGLRPPQPGAQRPQEKEIRDQARETVTGRNTGLVAGGAQLASNSGPGGGAPRTQGERALLGKAGALDADPAIRRTVDRESTLLAEADSDFIDRLIFWQEKPEPGTVVDPQAESKRIREALAQGEAPKGETPTIKRRKKGWLEGIF